MVMRRSDIKRISKDVSDTLEDNPKRTKVHAQRKFAQGSGMNSPVMTPIKDKEKTKVNGASSSPELLPSKRPRTEDFLTFLCFRGTEALPPRLDFFNLASKSTKHDKDGSTAGCSKQTSSSQQESKVKKVKNKLKNAKVVHSLKNNIHDKRLGTRSTRLSQKSGSTLHTRSRQLQERQKKVVNVVTKKQIVHRGRPAHHPSILKRLGATRLRTGLRSGGQLPPGSDIGIKSDRKPRKKLMRTKVNKFKKEAVTRTNIAKRKNNTSTKIRNEPESEDEDGDDEDDEDNEIVKGKGKHSLEEKKKEDEFDDDETSDSDEEIKAEPAPKKSCRISTRLRASSGSPALPPNSLSVATRPTRKTKEAATLYMEMLTKDLRSPEEEEEEEEEVFGKISSGNVTSTKRLDESSESSKHGCIKKHRQNKTSEQSAQTGNKEKQISEIPVLTRASRRGRMRFKGNTNLTREDIRVTRGQSGLRQWSRGRPSLRRGRGRPPLTRAPVTRRVLRNVRKVTNFAEDESNTEDEEDEMFVESNFSEELEQLEVGPERLRHTRSSVLGTKYVKNNSKKEIDNDNLQKEQVQEPAIEEKPLNKRKTRGSTVQKTDEKQKIDESSEEDRKRQTRASKDKEDTAKEQKRSLSTRRSRPDNSESDLEKNTSLQKEKPPAKKGRRDSTEKTKEVQLKDKQVLSASKPECSGSGKKIFLPDSKESEDTSVKVVRNQSDQSVAYLLLSLAQVKEWPGSETDCHSNEENSAITRNTRSSIKEFTKEEVQIRRGRRRNTSLDTSLDDRTEEEKQPTTSKKNKRESLPFETSIKGKTRSSKISLGRESELLTEDGPVSNPVQNMPKAECGKKIQKKESLSNKNKTRDANSSSDSDNEKSMNRRTTKSISDDGAAAFSSKRSGRHKHTNKSNLNTSESEIDTKLDIESKVKEDVKQEKRGRKRSGSVKKGESLDNIADDDDDVDLKSNHKNDHKLNKNKSFQNLQTVSSKSNVGDSVKEPPLQKTEYGSEIGCGRIEISTERVDNFKFHENNVLCQDSVVLGAESKRMPILIRKSSVDSHSSNSNSVDCKELIETIDVSGSCKQVSEDISSTPNLVVDTMKENNSVFDDNIALQMRSYEKEQNVMEINAQECTLSGVSEELYDLNNQNIDIKEVNKNPVEVIVKMHETIDEDITTSDESDVELNDNAGKELFENRANLGSRKRFPRRSRKEYYSQGNNRDVPKRVVHNRKVKSVNERYINEDSYSSDISTTSEESEITTLKSQKRIKPKNSTQNDAIESAMREAQNAIKKQDQKGDTVSYQQPSKVEHTVTNMNLLNLSVTAPEKFKKEKTEINYHGSGVKFDKCSQDNFSSAGENKHIDSLLNVSYTVERRNEKSSTVEIASRDNMLKENLTLVTKTLSLHENSKSSKHEQISQSNPSMVKSNFFSAVTDATGKQLNIEGENKKQSMSETWRQAFKNAKIPKPGQSGTVPHGVKPFVRKPFTTSSIGTKQSEILKGVNPNLTKMTSVMNQFKSSAFQSMGKYSPSRPFPNGDELIKSQSPSRRAIEVRDSPSKSSVSSSDDSRVLSSDGKKTNEQPVKSLTQLQYEKRSSDLISSLKDAPLIIDPSYPLAPFTSKLKEAAIEAAPQRISKPSSPSPLKPTNEGKHLNLPLAVEHTLRKMSPITVSKKPLVVKNTSQMDKKVSQSSLSDKQKEILDEVKDDSVKSGSQVEETAAPRTSNIEMLGKKKVNMTTEEIKRWLDDSTSSGIEHAKDCGIFEKNECECSYRTSGPSMLVGRAGSVADASAVATVAVVAADGRGLLTPNCPQNVSKTSEFKVDRGFVEPPVQLRELAEIASKYGEEIISTCKVEEFQEREMTKNKEVLQKQQRRQSTGFKSDRSMTEEEMCEFDFRSLVESSTDKGGNSGGNRRRPEQKVRPLAARAPPPVGTVQPTFREGTDQNPAKTEKPRQASQGTQSSPSPRPSTNSSVNTNLKEPSDSSGLLKTKGNFGKVKNNQCPVDDTGNVPKRDGEATMLEAPTFYPTEKEFGDPLEYIEKITPLAQHLGICRIVPPPNFKPECKVSDDMRFTAYNQYIHKMLHRWGPNVREMSAIRKYLATQNIALNQPPWIGGMEVDLPRLYQTVQQCGGLKEVYEKKRWTKVADVMKIPRSAQDRVTKLDDIYCKFLLPYDTLSHSERSKLLEEVDVEWREREKRMMEEDEGDEKEEGSDNESDTDERDECITKGKSVALSGFYRIARNTMTMWFSKDSTPTPLEVENEFWRHVTERTAHVCVHSGSIDTATWGCGFPTGKERSSARHPWNLKILTNNPRSILRSLGPVIGVTVPTLHVGMLFSACCWYRDPHALPWIEYLHTGANKIWYGVPDSWSKELKVAVKSLMPRYCREKKKIWLASDTVMVPPQLLVEHGVSVCRTVQEPGHFVVVFPRAFTSSLCTGYLVSESVYFAHSSWLDTSRSVFKDIQDSCEPPIFSLEKLLFNIATDIRSSAEVLTQILPMVIELRNEEVSRRKILEGFGLIADEKLPVTKGRRTKSQEDPNEYECEICRGNLFLSLVTNTQDEINYCLVHAIEVISKDKDVLKHCKLMCAYDEEEMEELTEKIKTKIETKIQKKQGKSSNSSSCSKS